MRTLQIRSPVRRLLVSKMALPSRRGATASLRVAQHIAFSMAFVVGQRSAFYHSSGLCRRAASTSTAWSREDEDKLIQLRLAGNTRASIAPQLGRTASAVNARLSRLKKTRPELTAALYDSGRYFTKTEDDILRAMKAAGNSWKEIAKSLPGRHVEGVRSRFAEIRRDTTRGQSRSHSPETFVRGRIWTGDDDQELRRLRTTLGLSLEETSVKLGRSIRATAQRCHRLGFTNGSMPLYTAEEDAIILSKSKGMTWEELVAQQLPGRTKSSAIARNSILMDRYSEASSKSKPSRRWTPEEDALLRDLRAEGASIEDVRMALRDRSSFAIIARSARSRIQAGASDKPS